MCKITSGGISKRVSEVSVDIVVPMVLQWPQSLWQLSPIRVSNST